MYNAFITNFKLNKHYIMTSSDNESITDFENRVFNKYSKESHEVFFFKTNV